MSAELDDHLATGGIARTWSEIGEARRRQRLRAAWPDPFGDSITLTQSQPDELDTAEDIDALLDDLVSGGRRSKMKAKLVTRRRRRRAPSTADSTIDSPWRRCSTANPSRPAP